MGGSYRRRADLITVIPGGTVLVQKLTFPWMMILEIYSAEKVVALGNFSKEIPWLYSLHYLINTLV